MTARETRIMHGEDCMIHPVPYVRGVAEYAVEVRKKIRELEGRDFLIAVDLPHGLESEVMKAVKILPRVSLIIDPLKRGILVIPSCAAVEAVRSFLDVGTDCYFIDTSLPVTGKMQEWRRFIDVCREYSPKEAVEHAEEYGINLLSLIGGDQDRTSRIPLPFTHLVGNLGIDASTGMTSPGVSEYLETRQRYMAMRLQELVEKEMDILLVCERRHYEKVMGFLKEPEPRFDDTFILPTVTCRVKEEDMILVSPEIPYFVFLAELWRNEGFSRNEALSDLFTMERDNRAGRADAALRYSMNLALSEGQLYPDLFNIVSSAKYAGDDAYAHEVLEKAKKYPYADRDSTCQIVTYLNYDLESGNTRTVTIEGGHNPEWISSGKKRKRKSRSAASVFHFSRTAGSREAESDFMRYLKRRYVSLGSSEEFSSDRFQSGFRDGIDCSNTLRYQHTQAIYVKEPVLENQAAYVVNFGGTATWTSYFDTEYSLVGAAATSSSSAKSWVCFTAFLQPPGEMEEFLSEIDLNCPLESCLRLALEHAGRVFLFTDSFEEKGQFQGDLCRIQVHQLSSLPAMIREPMRWFYLDS